MSADLIKTQLLRLDEFKYNFGDPRTNVLGFLADSFAHQVETYLDPTSYKFNELFKCLCAENSAHQGKIEHTISFPEKIKSQTMFQERLEAGSKPILAIPLIVWNKFKCHISNRSKHMNIVLYNRKTHELERIDIKKQHLEGFLNKLTYKKIASELLKYIKAHDGKTTMVSDHDVHEDFVKKHKDVNIKAVYPLYMISYLTMRCKHPGQTSAQIHTKTAQLGMNEIYKNWDAYVKYCSKQASKILKSRCSEDQIHNLETGMCIRRASKAYTTLLADPPVKVCTPPKVFNIFTNKCTSPEKLKDVNIYLEEALGFKVDRKTKLESLGLRKQGLAAVVFVMSKHQNGHLVSPPVTDFYTTKQKARSDIAVLWEFVQEKKPFQLTLFKGFWKLWDKGMASSARFLVVLVSLKSSYGGMHANALIYDKQTNELERFDGLGGNTHESYETDALDKRIQKLFKSKLGKNVPEGMTYHVPFDYCPRQVFQYKELNEVGFDDVGGNCAVWRTWYIDTRLANPDLTRKQVAAYANKKIGNYGSYQKFIKSYQAYLLHYSRSIRDVLKQGKLPALKPKTPTKTSK